MVGIIIISEGKAAFDMVKTVGRILDKKNLNGIEAVTLKSSLNSRTLKTKINTLIKKIDADGGVLLLTELYGSTQSNVCKDFLQKGSVEMITGYNLPMIIKAATLNQTSTLGRVANATARAGQKYIKRFS